MPDEAVARQSKGQHVDQKQVPLVPQGLLLVGQQNRLAGIPVEEVRDQHVALRAGDEHHEGVPVSLVVVRRRPEGEAEERQVLHDVEEAGQDAQQSPASPDVLAVVLEVHLCHRQPERKVQKDGQPPDSALGLVVADGRRHGGQVVGHIAVGVGAAHKVKGQRPGHAEEEASQRQTERHDGQPGEGQPEEDALRIVEPLVRGQHLGGTWVVRGWVGSSVSGPSSTFSGTLS